MTRREIVRIAREVLEVEARGVLELCDRIGDEFVRAVELLHRSRGRVIVIGMGKSGLVGRKLCATLASCGTPAVYIHPAEAGHGDLGMIRKDDVVIAISYSGETREIVGLLDFIKRIGVKLIAITGNRGSRIAVHSDIVLDARVEREAGPGNIIPTASSTAALALGDALAVALMRKRGFSEEDFAFVHPRGSAGRRLLKVEKLMHRGTDVPIVPVTARMSEVIPEMSAKKLGMTCVVDEAGRLAGIITDGDLRRLLEKGGRSPLTRTAGQCMTRNPVTVGRDDLATMALNIMEEKRITSLVIKDADGRVEGIIHLHDLWRTEMV